jgi:hypothetical protein
MQIEEQDASEVSEIGSRYLQVTDEKSVNKIIPSAKNRCSRVLYNEFMNCDSYLYNVPAKENSEEISSDGEFNDFKYFNMVDQNSTLFHKDEYEKLIRKKYAEQPETMQVYLEAKNNYDVDYDLRKQAQMNLDQKVKEHSYLNKRLVTKN